MWFYGIYGANGGKNMCARLRGLLFVYERICLYVYTVMRVCVRSVLCVCVCCVYVCACVWAQSLSVLVEFQ